MPFVSFLPFDNWRGAAAQSVNVVGIFIGLIVMNLFQLQLNRVSELH